MTGDCVLALDLGTTAFKAAAVDADGVRGRVAVAPYALDYAGDGAVTCDPERYVRTAFRALRAAARTARAQDLRVRAVGISSQAQTYVALDARNQPVQPAVVWTDARPVEEAAEAALALPDFARTSGFLRPSPMQFLPKLMRFRREGKRARRFLLLNEWIVLRLTGQACGDSMIQGMSGFYDVARGDWNPRALELAGITPDHLAAVAPPSTHGAALSPAARRALDLPDVPVYSCGNDQSCAALGAGVVDAADVFCNFGTALVVYALKDRPAAPATDDQIAGIGPLPGSWFLLALESECGNLVEGLARLLYPRGGVGRMIDEALRAPASAAPPQILPVGGGRMDIRGLSAGCRREELARALLEFYATRFGEALAGVVGDGPAPRRLLAGGGMSRSAPWRAYLEQRHGVALEPTAGEHPGLVGVARAIARNPR